MKYEIYSVPAWPFLPPFHSLTLYAPDFTVSLSYVPFARAHAVYNFLRSTRYISNRLKTVGYNVRSSLTSAHDLIRVYRNVVDAGG